MYNLIYIYIHHISLNMVMYELILLYIVWCLVDIWYHMLVLCPEILSHVKGMVIPTTQLGISTTQHGLDWHGFSLWVWNPRLQGDKVCNKMEFNGRKPHTLMLPYQRMFFFSPNDDIHSNMDHCHSDLPDHWVSGTIPLSAVLCIFSPWIFQGFSNAVWFCRPQIPVVIKPWLTDYHLSDFDNCSSGISKLRHFGG